MRRPVACGAQRRRRKVFWLLRGPLAMVLAGSLLAGARPALAGSCSAPVGASSHRIESCRTREAASAHPFTGGVLSTGPGVTVAPNRVLVRFRSGVSAAREAQVRHSMGATLMRAYRLVPGLELVKVGPGSGPKALDAAASLAHNPSVRYATPDIAYHVQAVPDDSLYEEQWGMESIGAPEAWDRSTGSKSVIVAVLDSGITLNHPDLEANIWTNPSPGQNGYVNDIHGWNFVANNNDPVDDFGHGTGVAGVIGAVGDNGVGVTGVNWSVSLMPLKICDEFGVCYFAAEIAALEYAVDHGAKVANASYGAANGGYKPEEEAIDAAGKAGLLFVAGAGNRESSNDVLPFYPASYPLSNIISVAATTSSDMLAGFSNYGATSVQLGAPGEGIWSTLPTAGPLSSRTGYGYLDGTSMAAPQVTGAAALLWSLHPSWTMQQVRSRLLATTRPLPSLFGKVSSCGELDVGAAANPALPELASLCVTQTGTGSGSVSSSPAGIECGSSCSTTFAPGTQETLSATPAAGSTFAGWRGACTGTGSCTVSPTTAASVTASFHTPGTPAGWEEQPLAPPVEREPFAPRSIAPDSFFNVSLSTDGTVRAKTIFNRPSNECVYASSDTGGVFLEHKTASGWVSDGSLTAPALGSDIGARWANCSYYGAVTELSGDGSTLLVTPEMDSVETEVGPRYRCAAFVYRHGESGWALDGTLFPPGIGTAGSSTWEGCDYFGVGGAISEDGTRVAVLSGGRVDVFVRGASGWSLERHIVLPEGPGCTESIGPRQIALSGDGATLLVSDPECETNGHGASGRVYAYTRSGSTWSLAQTIDSPEPQFQNEFGGSIAISADGSTATFQVGRSVTGLQPEAGAAWVFEHNAGGWHAVTRLTAPTPEEGGYFSCPTIIENGSRIICQASDTIGFDSRQGAMYIFEQPVNGWAASGSPPTRLFATDGAAGDELGQVGQHGWPAFAAAADGSLIDATISLEGLANGTYPNDRIGYEFSTVPAIPPTPTITGFSSASGAIGSTVTITGTNLRGASAVSFNATRTGSYAIESATQITATVPEGATTGPISVTTRGGTATSTGNFTVLTSISTTASGPAIAGGMIHDTATLLGGAAPTGTIAFRLYASSDTECSKPLGEALSTSVTKGNGAYESPAILERTPGFYQWVASYSGDANNATANGACNDPNEQVIVQAQPSISTTASGAVAVGTQIHDTAHLSGGTSPTGTITFNLYATSDHSCSTVLASNTATVNGNGEYDSPPVTTSSADGLQWVASYSGDAENLAASTACNDPSEQVNVGHASPVLTTTASAGVPAGATINDIADLGGGFSPTGTISFQLYASSDEECSQPIGPPATIEVDADGTYESPAIPENTPGSYQWVASYSGDANNAPARDACNDLNEQVIVQALGHQITQPPTTTSILTTTETPGTASVHLTGTRITTTRGGKARIKLTCTGTGAGRATCSGRLTLTAKSAPREGKRGKMETIGAATFSIPSGKTTIVEAKLNAGGKVLLSADHGRLNSSLTVLKSSPAPSQGYTENVQLVRMKARGKTKQ
jgi:subtilisin family serine protease